MTAPADFVFLDATLTPNRSLSATGFKVLMAVIAILCLVSGIAFFLIGAWPVVGFLGLDVLLVLIAFRASYRAGRLTEFVRVTRRALTVERLYPNGFRQTLEYPPLFVQVVVESRDEHHVTIRVRFKGKSIVIGSFLSPGERREFAAVLKDAIDRARVIQA